MHFLPSALRGPAWMVAATGVYVANDTLMKLATDGLPPLQVLAMRGVCATLWCLPVVLALGHGRDLKKMFNRWVLLRNGFELLAVMGFVIALAQLPIADITALGQVTPLVFLLGIAFVMREKVGGMKMALISLGFAGAVMVAQPGADGISIYALLGLSNAVFCAARDIAGRQVPTDVPAWIVTLGAILLVMVGAGIVSALSEQWMMPEPRHIALLFAAGFFLMLGHFCLFTAYRVGEAATVAPFFYMFSVWAVISGLAVFGQFPNALAACGIAFILASGITIVLLDNRKRRLSVVA